ncbi:hypothetical protein [Motilimonas sp. 1_MG-2023]|uniref:hypothetical protein n=1 Tax=Motilimonas TaxID=1914248 RepID=UPI0026E34022|nr:hypothetical protein [Motilimonas sp. 1_MG-2023]MDO6524962.1 hypothetical protein [Motilimonas sp. 1_MG-2023]
MERSSTQLLNLIDRTCQSFRLAQEAKGNHFYTQLIDALEANLPKLAADKAAYLNQILPPLFAAQSRRDTLFLCDILEYEIRPLFETQ